MGMFRFLTGQKETGAERVAMATAQRVSMPFFFDVVLIFKNTASIFPEISFIQYFTTFYSWIPLIRTRLF